MLVGMVTWPGEREPGRIEGGRAEGRDKGGSFVSGE